MKSKKKVHHNLSISTDKIIVRKHAIQRYKERQQKNDLPDKDVTQSIIGQIKHSKLIGIDGTTEHRMFNGYIYVVERKREFYGDTLYVITMKLSNKKKRQHYLDRFDADHNEIVA